MINFDHPKMSFSYLVICSLIPYLAFGKKTKTLQDPKRLPSVHLIGCLGVKLFLPKDFKSFEIKYWFWASEVHLFLWSYWNALCATFISLMQFSIFMKHFWELIQVFEILVLSLFVFANWKANSSGLFFYFQLNFKSIFFDFD